MCNFISRSDKPPTASLTVAVKDCIDVKGFITTCASAALAESEPAQDDAAVVTTLRKFGASIVGKTNMHELAFGMTGVNTVFGTPVNPMYRDYITGGSSSGSAAAVAAKEVSFSVGTDTGGSIRVPAACCGIAGHKPTFGRISRKGALPALSSLDAIGPLASTPDALEIAMQAIDETFSPLKDVRPELEIGRLSLSGTTANDRAMDCLLNRYCATYNKTIQDVPLPKHFTDAYNAALTVMSAEVWQSFATLESTKLASDVALRLKKASEVTAVEVAEAEKVRSEFSDELDQLLTQFDVLVLPTLQALPMKREAALAGEIDLSISAYTRPFNLSGHPALVMPMFDESATPLSIQLVTRKGEDEVLFAVARRLWNLTEKQR